MKTNVLLKIMLPLAVAAALALTACEDDPQPSLKPEMKLTSDETMTVPVEGGDFSITYILENPSEEGRLEAIVSDDAMAWINITDTETEGHVAFEVSENTGMDSRDGEISIIYRWPGGETDLNVNVMQSGKNPDPVLVPETESVDAPSSGGDYIIEYSIDNPVEGGRIEAKSGQDWISGITSDMEGQVRFTVLKNETDTSREGEVTVMYVWPGGEPVSFSIPVVQVVIPFNLEVYDVMGRSAMLRIQPTDNEMTYFDQIMEKSYFEMMFVSKEDIGEYFKDAVIGLAENSGMSLSDFLNNALDVGYKEQWWSALIPETEHVAFVVGMDYEADYLSEFVFAPDFMTIQSQLGDLYMDMSVTPKVYYATADIVPSDLESDYIVVASDAAAIDASGLDDLEIMQQICDELGWDLMFGAVRGEQSMKFEDLNPDTEYYLFAFGVDTYEMTYVSELSKAKFRTNKEMPTDASVIDDIRYYWDQTELREHYPDLMEYYDGRALVALDLDFNESAEACYVMVWGGDQSEYEYLKDFTLSMGHYKKKGDPALIFEYYWGDTNTISIIAEDKDGNYADMYIKVFTLDEQGVSDDFDLFYEYYSNSGGLGGGIFSTDSFEAGEDKPDRINKYIIPSEMKTFHGSGALRYRF